jgi:tetratricopeptide (TPR) repeat protein
MIVKADDEEAKLLDRCLSYVAPYVDDIYLTFDGKNEACKVVAEKYNASVSTFPWVKDFARSRNFNFSKARTDYILWLDCDDVLRGAKKLKETIGEMEKNNVDAVALYYLYDFDKHGKCIVKHLKARIVKNDGSFEWKGAIHEDLHSKREVNQFLDEKIEVLHLPEKGHTEDASKRNLVIAEETYEKDKEDPRNLWLLASAYWGVGDTKEAKEWYLKFVEVTGSEEEKYLAYLHISDFCDSNEEAFTYLGKAFILRPSYPNTYIKIAKRLLDADKLQTARQFAEIGLQMPRPDDKIIVFNPREYDYVPLSILLEISWRKGEYNKAYAINEEILKIYPKDKDVLNRKKMIDTQLGEILKIDEYITRAEAIKDKGQLKLFLNSLPYEISMHPKMCLFRNTNFIKTESSGKDLVYYCSYTSKEWSPKSVKEGGVGGSEEAVINLTKSFAQVGYNVTVYNNCGKDAGVYEGVTYRPFWDYNVRDKQDITIFWRHPRFLDYAEPQNGRLFLDMHDVLPAEEFTRERVEKIEKVFVKSQAHRLLFPTIPYEKFVVVPNGIDVNLFENKVKRNPYMLLNTSSADRQLEASLSVIERLIEKSPDKPWVFEWYYGWGVYDEVHKDNPEMMEWKSTQMARFDALKALGRAKGGIMVSHTEIAKKYQEAGFFLYPTQFFEIDCISAAKAQMAGSYVVSSDFAALDETVQSGTKINTDGKRWGTENTFGDMENVDKYVDVILANVGKEVSGVKIRKQRNWDIISSLWIKNLG